MDSTTLKEYKYNGARSLVLLHERYLKSFLLTWQNAKRLNIALPETQDQDYKSLDTLLRHVLGSAGGYMVWICWKLNLPDPGIRPAPESDLIESEVNEYLIYLLDKWQLPLVEIPEDKFHSPVYSSNWGVDYCIDAMLEHAVMHPIRHEFQLRKLINEQ
jgi:hypothetical protein